MSIRSKKNQKRAASTLRNMRERRRRQTRKLKDVLRPKFKPYTKRIAAQITCHQVFDRLWCGPNRVMLRRAAYRYLAEITGFPKETAHIKFLDETMCDKVIERVVNDFPKLFPKAA